MTKDTEKALVILYSEYKRRRNFGTSKAEAVCFEEAKMRKIDAFSNWSYADVSYAMQELKAAGYVRINICDDITLTETAIEFIESRPKEFFDQFANVAKDILSLVSGFLSI